MIKRPNPFYALMRLRLSPAAPVEEPSLHDSMDGAIRASDLKSMQADAPTEPEQPEVAAEARS